MKPFSILNNKIKLQITNPSSGVRICDDNGNHVRKPTELEIDFNNYYVEWMITNSDLIEIIKLRLNELEIKKLISRLKLINVFLVDSGYNTRKAHKNKIKTGFNGFDVFEYKEVFYSFERNLGNNISTRVTFKMGDYTLAAHMFVLIGFNSGIVNFVNYAGEIENNTVIGSKAYCLWNINKEYVLNIINMLATSSTDHRNSLINLLIS